MERLLKSYLLTYKCVIYTNINVWCSKKYAVIKQSVNIYVTFKLNILRNLPSKN